MAAEGIPGGNKVAWMSSATIAGRQVCFLNCSRQTDSLRKYTLGRAVRRKYARGQFEIANTEPCAAFLWPDWWTAMPRRSV
jgi:hypothetical protein